jgi:hypothetical protein
MRLMLRDTFTDADGTSLYAHTPEKGERWFAHPTTPSASYVIDNNRVRNTATTSVCYNDTQIGVNVRMEVEVVYFTSSTGLQFWMRMDPVSATGYMVRIEGAGNLQVYRCVAGTFTALGTQYVISPAPTSGTVYQVVAEISGTRIQVWLDGVLRRDETVATISTGTRTGLRDTVAQSTSSGKQFNSISAYDLDSSEPIIVGANEQEEARAYGSRTRLWRVDRFGNRQEEVHLPSVTSASLTCNEDATPRKALSIDIAEPGVLSPLRDYVQPEVTLIHPDGTTETETLGTYLVTGRRATGTSAVLKETIEAVDLTIHLQASTAQGVSWPAGTDTGAAMRDLVLACGFSPDQVVIPDSGYLLPAAKAPNPGTKRLPLAAELATTGNQYVPFMDRRGRIVTSSYVDIVSAPLAAEYGSGSRLRWLAPVSEEPDYSRLYNSVTVRKIDTQDPTQTIAWTARITNPAHPLFWNPEDPDQGIGYEIALDPPIDDQDIETVEQAKAIAQARLSEGASYYQRARVSAIADLRADLHQVVSLTTTVPRLSRYNGRWRRRTWTLRLSGISARIEMELYRVTAWE